MNCYYCGKLLGDTDPKVVPNSHPTLRQCADCNVDYGYITERGHRPLLNLLTKVIRNPGKEPRPPLPESVATAIARMPENFYLKCAVEQYEKDGPRFLSACIFEIPPDDGWTLPTYFNEPPGVKRAHMEEWLEKYRHDDVVRVGVSAAIDDPQSFEAQIVSMINSKWPWEKT